MPDTDLRQLIKAHGELWSRPVSRVLSWAIIHLGRRHRRPQATYPGVPGRGHPSQNAGPLPYLVLLRVGFTMPRHVTSRAVRSYRTFSPLPRIARRYIFCGTFRGLAPPRRYLAPSHRRQAAAAGPRSGTPPDAKRR